MSSGARIVVVGRLPANDAPRLVGVVATERQRLGLGDQVGDEQVVVVAQCGWCGLAKPMKSAGTISVPWWSSW